MASGELLPGVIVIYVRTSLPLLEKDIKQSSLLLGSPSGTMDCALELFGSSGLCAHLKSCSVGSDCCPCAKGFYVNEEVYVRSLKLGAHQYPTCHSVWRSW